MTQQVSVDAAERAIELLNVKRSQLPPKALRFRDFMWRKHAMCMEVGITAFAVYAQFEEGATTDDSLYDVRSSPRAGADWCECFGEGA